MKVRPVTLALLSCALLVVPCCPLMVPVTGVGGARVAAPAR